MYLAGALSIYQALNFLAAEADSGW
jgi:hypothetical protein